MASLNDAGGKELLNGRFIGTLGTHGPDGSVHMVAVWYGFDGSDIFVATSSRSRKARNVDENPKVSLMIDSRDVAASRGITVVGTARVIRGEESRKRNLEIHRKYLSAAALADARVGPVFAGWDDIALQITPDSVIAWDMREADKQVFGGAFEGNPDYLLPVER